MYIKKILWSLIGISWIFTANACKSEDKEEQVEDRVVISGTIENYDKNKFQFIYDVFSPLEDTKKEVVEIEEDGDFHITIQTEDPIKGTLNFGRVMIESRGIQRNIAVYAEPGDSLHVEANVDLLSDMEMLSNTLTFSGSGVSNNYYLKHEDETFNSYPQRVQNNHRFIADKGPNEYTRIVDSIRDRKLEYLQAYADTSSLSPRLKNFFEADYKNLAVIRKVNYPTSNERFNDGVAQTLPPDYYDFMEDEEISEDLADQGLPYFRYLHFYLTNKYELARQNGYEKNYLSFLDSELEGRAKHLYMAYSLGRNFDPDVYAQFDEDSPYPDIAEKVKEKYSHLESMLPGKPAPEVLLTTLENDTLVSSEFFEDKFVYIDFWATWCKPCIREIPYILKLEEEYHDENITFVSISFDEEKEKWLNYVQEEGLTGVQLWVDPENKKIYDEGFNITMIPRFVLIDDEGKIVDSNAPYPSSGEDIRNLLNEALDKEKSELSI